MKITEKDLEKITKMKKKYKFLKGMTTDEIVDLFLARCEHCEELCFATDLVPVPNFKGIVHRVCEECSKEILDNMFYSKEDYELQHIEDMREETC